MISKTLLTFFLGLFVITAIMGNITHPQCRSTSDIVRTYINN